MRKYLYEMNLTRGENKYIAFHKLHELVQWKALQVIVFET